MAKASMRPETKAAKLRNNKTSNIHPICSCKKSEVVIYSGSHDNRTKKCWDCHTKPPQVGERQIELYDQLKRAGLL